MRLPVAALVVLAISGCIVDGQYLVRGTVRSADPARSPVAGARVSIEECVPRKEPRETATTDSRGAYELACRFGGTCFPRCPSVPDAPVEFAAAGHRPVTVKLLDAERSPGWSRARCDGERGRACYQLDALLEPTAGRGTAGVPPGERMGHMRIKITSVLVDDQKKALRFYTEVLGFQKKQEVPLGDDWWLTVVSPDAPDGTELLLEPDRHPAARPFKQALVKDGIPFTSFAVDDVYAEYARLKALGVRFTQPPLDAGPVVIAVFDDTCGNLIQIAAKKAP